MTITVGSSCALDYSILESKQTKASFLFLVESINSFIDTQVEYLDSVQSEEFINVLRRGLVVYLTNEPFIYLSESRLTDKRAIRSIHELVQLK